ncbi:unnamed protein product [Acanthoscelides obtectus]|uniref:PiggyBac transposable element-derived protein domain-containing protein n=1 Tax=Acanthoscelides obtectus TaxID=200917 RepID=A0A9P0QDF5_ACAOB|nr:unnamed protein product [Acanthoscelides obtectus]CAK1667557.1 PiggyBac transposable element-derived protein 4 [Acanthoscelides obtectus]
MSDPKRRCVQTSRDPEVWMQWFNEISSGEESPLDEEDSDEKEEDVCVESDHHETESEQEIPEVDQDEPDWEEETDEGEADIFYWGKDKVTKWKKGRSNTQVRTRSQNIIKLLPGTKGSARNARSETDCLKLFINDTVIRIITISTNIYIMKVKSKFQRFRDARQTDEREITAFIGILILIGTLRSSRKNLKNIWDNSKGSGVEACYLAMSEKRFRFLIRCLRFDDIRTRDERKEIDKLAPIRELFETFLVNFQNNFIASEYLTVDEQLLAFRGRCGFKQFIPSKPAKYGIKTFALCDSKTSYTFNLETYVGTQPEGPYKLSNSSEDIVIRLVNPVAGTNRNITGDNWFTSLSLVKKLLQEKKLTYIGTMRKNKREIPPQFLPNKNRPEKSSLFGFQKDCTMVSYCPKKNRSVILLSSMHFDDAIDEETGDDKKPVIIADYNHTKIDVDLVDQLCQKYNVARNTRRWPTVVFYNLINISGINALCVYKANHPPQKRIARSDFLQSCAWDLIRPQIEFRSTIPSLPVDMRRRARATLNVREVSPSPSNQPKTTVGRCHICPRQRDKSTRKICSQCRRFACKQHMSDTCTACLKE